MVQPKRYYRIAACRAADRTIERFANDQQYYDPAKAQADFDALAAPDAGYEWRLMQFSENKIEQAGGRVMRVKGTPQLGLAIVDATPGGGEGLPPSLTAHAEPRLILTVIDPLTYGTTDGRWSATFMPARKIWVARDRLNPNYEDTFVTLRDFQRAIADQKKEDAIVAVMAGEPDTLTRSFRETVADRSSHDPEFRAALREGYSGMHAGFIQGLKEALRIIEASSREVASEAIRDLISKAEDAPQ